MSISLGRSHFSVGVMKWITAEEAKERSKRAMIYGYSMPSTSNKLCHWSQFCIHVWMEGIFYTDIFLKFLLGCGIYIQFLWRAGSCWYVSPMWTRVGIKPPVSLWADPSDWMVEGDPGASVKLQAIPSNHYQIYSLPPPPEDFVYLADFQDCHTVPSSSQRLHQPPPLCGPWAGVINCQSNYILKGWEPGGQVGPNGLKQEVA